MARYKFLGEPARPYVVTYGPCLNVTVPSKTGKVTYEAADQVTGFVIGNDIGFEITDTRSLRILDADNRFEKIV